MACMTSLFSIVPLSSASYLSTSVPPVVPVFPGPEPSVGGAGVVSSQNRRPRDGKSFFSTSCNPLGMQPVNWFLEMDSDFRLVRLPNSSGIVPVSRLPLRFSDFRLVRLPNSSGIVPVSRLPLRFSDFRLIRLPSSPGIDPGNWAKTISRDFRLVRFPNSSGIVPG